MIGKVIGIVGGGQLGKMSAMAALNLGFRVAVMTNSHDSPAAQVSPEVIVADYNDADALMVLAKKSDYITFEFENISVATLRMVEEAGHIVRPSSSVLAISQDRLLEKDSMRAMGLRTADYIAIESSESLSCGIEAFGFPAILKKRRLGYDGKGQYIISNERDLRNIIQTAGLSGCILEKFVDFKQEVSVIIARGADGHMVALPPAINNHVHGILDTSSVPSGLPGDAEVVAIGMRVASNLGLVGVLAVEMFYIGDGDVLINEIAPRPHNSGHWSMDCCSMSQFDLHIRAISGLPLVEPQLLRRCEMKNLIGDDIALCGGYLRDCSARVYVYGKSSVRPGRKMGHVNLVGGEI